MIHENLVEINLVDDCIIADLVEIVNTNVTRKSSRANTKISNRSRLDYNTNKTRSQHEDLEDFLCPDFQKFLPCGLTKIALHGTLAKSTTPQRVTDGYSRILSL